MTQDGLVSNVGLFSPMATSRSSCQCSPSFHFWDPTPGKLGIPTTSPPLLEHAMLSTAYAQTMHQPAGRLLNPMSPIFNDRTRVSPSFDLASL